MELTRSLTLSKKDFLRMDDSSILLIDNSNTRTKFRLARDGVLLPECRMLPTCDISKARVGDLLRGWGYSKVMMSSVVPEKRDILCAAFSMPVHSLSASSALNFSLEPYAGRSTIGADRLANAAALVSDYARYPAVAVDMGTAVTYEVVAHDGTQAYFAGGVIATGLRALSVSPADATAQLPQVEASLCVPALAQDTKSALQAGVLYGYAGMLRETLHALALQLGEKPFVVLTGGDAVFVKEYDDSFGILDKDLTMKGLLALSQMN